ncbi:MAG: archaemetzincin [Planctomycetota bacterium]
MSDSHDAPESEAAARAPGERCAHRRRRRSPWVVLHLALAVVSVAALVLLVVLRAPATVVEGPLPQGLDALRPLCAPLPEPGPGDWLAQHREPGQTYAAWLVADRVQPEVGRRTIAVHPLGPFTDGQGRILAHTVEYLRVCFNVPVRVHPAIPLDNVAEAARRRNPHTGQPQILTTWVLDDLADRLQDDEVVALALTASDLWPGRGWNFVFGQASLVDRVGVWSLYRNGDADGSPEDFRLCLLRTLKTATHETGHMFGMRHCTAYHCNMCGSNHRAESDAQPLANCPECLAKFLHVGAADAVVRFAALAEFCRDNGLHREAAVFQRSRAVLRGAAEAGPQPATTGDQAPARPQ